MLVGVPKEVKAEEYRVAILPVGADRLTRSGHKVLIQTGAGEGSGVPDAAYIAAGATIVDSQQELYALAELVVKVKEPQPQELGLLRPHHILFGYLHLAASEELTRSCLQAGFTGLAYETLSRRDGALPLLTPMSQVAGRMAAQAGASFLERPAGGRGVLLAGVPGVVPGEALVLGAGVVGTNAALILAGMGASVTLLDINQERLTELEARLPANVRTRFSDGQALHECTQRADLVIGAVLLPGRAAPKLITRQHLQRMKVRSVLVDVCIDQGGCAETSRPTTHAEPTYLDEGVVHYCVANIPGAVPVTSTPALCNVTLPHICQLADLGVSEFTKLSTGHRKALNVAAGKIVNQEVASVFLQLPSATDLEL